MTTEVLFSAWVMVWVAAEEAVVIVGASLTLVMVMAIDWLAKFPNVSVALTDRS